MAVPKRKTSRSKRDMRRTHDALGTATVTTDSTTGERHLRHHISAEGRYRGRQVIAQASEIAED